MSRPPPGEPPGEQRDSSGRTTQPSWCSSFVTAFTLRKKSAVRTDKSPPYFQPSRVAILRCPHLLSGVRFPGVILVTAVGLRAGRCLRGGGGRAPRPAFFLENTGLDR